MPICTPLVLPADQNAQPGRFGSFEQHNCAICLGGLSRPVELACGHCFCYVCLASAANNNRRCPLCRQEHILDPDTLKSRRDSFREGYRAWRKGGANGARGEFSGVVTLSGASTNESLQNSMHTGKRSAADLLDCTGGALAENYQPQIKRQFFGDLEAVQKSNPIASPPRDTAAEDMSSIAEVLAMMRTCHKDPAPAAKLRVAAKRRRKSTLAVKRQLTGVMYVLCQAAQMPCIEAVEKNRLPQLGVLNPEGRFALIVKFGREASSIKEMMAVGITAILNALPDSPEREPLKWDTLQRDILWKYQRRIQSDSLYVYQEPSSTTSETIEQYGQEILNALAPRSVDDVLREPLRRYAQGANLEPLAPEMTNLQMQSAAAEAVKLENMFVPEASARCLVPASATGGSQPQAQEKKQQGQQGKDESSVLVCDVPGCTYSTIYRRYLDQHRRGHGAAKPYTCHWPGCTYACSGKGHLVRHIRVHTGEKPYKCTWPGCLYAATQSGHLTAHLRKHEDGKTRKNLTPTGAPSSAQAGAITHRSSPYAAAEAVPLACAVPLPPGKPPSGAFDIL